MRLSQLHIDGFGIFSDHTITGLQPGLNIVLGENEAGKSTLLQFIRFTLFGYPRPIEQRLPPVFGGAHGGRIKVITTDGTPVIMERSAGYPGDIQLHTADTTGDNDDDWRRVLGHASGDLFENVYAFSLDELVGLESLSRSGVEDKIFSIGLGLKNISISNIEQDLVSRMEAVYKPHGKKQQAILLLHEIETIERQLAEIQSHLPRYRRLTLEIRQDQETLEKTGYAMSDRQALFDRLSGYDKCYESFVIISDIDRELSNLPEWRGLPPEGLTRLEQMETEEARLKRERTDIREDLAAAGSDPAADYNTALLSHGERIEHLSLNLEKYKTWVEEHRQERLAVDERNHSIRGRINDLNESWTEETIRGFSDIISHRDRIDAFINRLETLQKNHERIEDRIGMLKARQSLINGPNAFILAGLALLAGAVPLMVYKEYLWGTVLMLMAIILISGRKLVTMDDPLKEAVQASGWLEAEKAVAAGEFQRYVDEELGLSPELSPRGVLASLQVIEQVALDIVARDKQHRRVREKEKFLQTFTAELNDLGGMLTESGAETEPALLASKIVAEYKRSVAGKNRAIEIQNELARKRAALKKTEQALADVAEKTRHLLASVQATNRNDFKEKYRTDARVGRLREQRRQALRTIEQIAGVHAADDVIACLNAMEKPALEKALAEAASDLQALRRERDEMNRKISSAETLRRQLRDSSDQAEVMTRLAVCRENLNRCRRDWLAAKLAHHVLQQVKSRYEQKKQPSIIRNSSHFFRRITADRYQRMQVSLEDGRLLVFDNNDRAWRVDQLSRGTREQLLISIRLGFIEEYEKKSEALPLVLDDVLVNFDPDRARRTAAILHEFSTTRQTLLFTCHPETRERFGDLPVNHVAI